MVPKVNHASDSKVTDMYQSMYICSDCITIDSFFWPNRRIVHPLSDNTVSAIYESIYYNLYYNKVRIDLSN